MLIALAITLSSCQDRNSEEPIVSGTKKTAQIALSFIVHPYDNPSRLIARFSPLVKYLGEQLAQPIDLIIARSYVDQIQRISSGQADLAYMGPTPFLRAQDHYLQDNAPKLIPLAAEVKRGDASYRSVIVVRDDAPILELEGLTDKTLAFGAPHSFSSHYVPRVMIGNAGISINHLRDYAFLGRHERVALSVLHGDFDAGGINEAVAAQYRERNPGLRIIATSPPLPPHLIVASPGFSTTDANALRRALINPPANSGTYISAMQAMGDATIFSAPNMESFERARRVISAVESAPTVLQQW